MAFTILLGFMAFKREFCLGRLQASSFPTELQLTTGINCDQRYWRLFVSRHAFWACPENRREGLRTQKQPTTRPAEEQ
jgi:hypothetical protein